MARTRAPLRRTLVAALLCLGAVGAASADGLTLAAPVIMRAGPGRHFRYVLTAPPGARVDLLREERIWSRVAVAGRRGFMVTADLYGPPAPPRLPPPVDPNCDYGYPYSGSGAYFAHPLTVLRHSEPLGALFGYHLRYPC